MGTASSHCRFHLLIFMLPTNENIKKWTELGSVECLMRTEVAAKRRDITTAVATVTHGTTVSFRCRPELWYLPAQSNHCVANDSIASRDWSPPTRCTAQKQFLTGDKSEKPKQESGLSMRNWKFHVPKSCLLHFIYSNNSPRWLSALLITWTLYNLIQGWFLSHIHVICAGFLTFFQPY